MGTRLSCARGRWVRNGDQDMKTYNVAFTIAFEVPKCTDPKGDDVTANQFRQAILLRLAGLDDKELLEAIGLGFDNYEDTDKMYHRHADTQNYIKKSSYY